MYTVYVLYSDAHDKHYTGYTSNMPLRLQSHNLYGHGWTKAYRPWRIIYTEEYHHKQQALIRERWLKSGAGRHFISGLAH